MDQRLYKYFSGNEAVIFHSKPLLFAVDSTKSVHTALKVEFLWKNTIHGVLCRVNLLCHRFSLVACATSAIRVLSRV